jgi:hypothetical protein
MKIEEQKEIYKKWVQLECDCKIIIEPLELRTKPTNLDKLRDRNKYRKLVLENCKELLSKTEIRKLSKYVI